MSNSKNGQSAETVNSAAVKNVVSNINGWNPDLISVKVTDGYVRVTYDDAYVCTLFFNDEDNDSFYPINNCTYGKREIEATMAIAQYRHLIIEAVKGE